MPELPEVEIVRLGLEAKIPGETIEKVEVLRQESIGYPAVSKFVSSLPGKTFAHVSRRGKYLLLHLQEKAKGEAGYLVVHLRMSGRLLLLEKEDLHKKTFRFLRVRIFLQSGRALCFEDMRVFGRLYYVSKANELLKAIPSFSKLGAEPLENLSSEKILDLFKNRKQAIKSALLNQNLIAGIGNIYADEILFQAALHPLTPAAKISAKKAEILAEIIPATLHRAIARGGSSIKDFVSSEGVNGNYQHESLVYGRSKQACHNCKSAIKRVKISGRSAHFCPRCQKRK